MMNSRNSRPWALVSAALLSVAGLARAQSLVFEGLLHHPLGDATLEINSRNQLVVGNIGTRGGDGVSVELGRADSFDMDVSPFPPGLPAGASFEFFARGSVADVPNLLVSQLRATRSSTLLRFEAVFPAFGTPPKTVEVYFEGFLVASVSGVSVAQVATVPPDAWPTKYGVRRHLLPHSRHTFVTEFAGPTPITLPGGMIASGDEFRVIAMTPSDNLDFVSQSGGTGSDVPDMFIDGEEIQPQCPGDVNGDGIVDLTDLTILLANFGRVGDVSLMDGNLDQDNDVDLGDLTELLSNFGNDCD